MTGTATRHRLPNRRRAVTFDVEHGGATYSVGIGLYDDDRLGEVFIGGARAGSDLNGLLADVGVLVSRGLQHGDSIEALAAATARLGDGTTPASVIGAVLALLAAPGHSERRGAYRWP